MLSSGLDMANTIVISQQLWSCAKTTTKPGKIPAYKGRPPGPPCTEELLAVGSHWERINLF